MIGVLRVLDLEYERRGTHVAFTRSRYTRRARPFTWRQAFIRVKTYIA